MAAEDDDESQKKPQQRSRRKVPRRPLVAPEPRSVNILTSSMDAATFMTIMGDRLLSSDSVLTHFQHNDEKDEDDYEKEASKDKKQTPNKRQKKSADE